MVFEKYMRQRLLVAERRLILARLFKACHYPNLSR